MCEQGFLRLLTSEPVQRAVRENALEEHGQLIDGLVPIVLGQLEHAVLHDIQGGLLIADVKIAALECALFYAFEECRQFLFCGQERVTLEKIGGVPVGKLSIIASTDVFLCSAFEGLVAVR